jgi:hypothetical protein
MWTHPMPLRALPCLLAAVLTSCATTLDPNYAAQLQAYENALRLQAEVARSRHDAEAARYRALADVGAGGNEQTRALAVLALGMAGGNSTVVNTAASSPPPIPESDGDRALKWAAILVPPLTVIAQSGFSYKLASQQTRYNAETTQSAFGALRDANFATAGVGAAGWNALGGALTNAGAGSTALGVAGFNALSTLGSNSLATIGGVATSSNQSLTTLGQSGFAALTDTARLIPQPPQSINNSGNSGVIGGGSNCIGGNSGTVTGTTTPVSGRGGC